MSFNIAKTNQELLDIVANSEEKTHATKFDSERDALLQAQRFKALVASTIELAAYFDPQLATLLAEQKDAAHFLKLTGTAATVLSTNSSFGLSNQTSSKPSAPQPSDSAEKGEGYQYKKH